MVQNMAYNAKGQKKYNAKSINLAVSYKPPERQDGQRIKAYLEQTGQSANSYIKALIKADLDNKGFVLPDGAENTDTDNIENMDSV